MSDNVHDATPEILHSIQERIGAIESSLDTRFSKIEAVQLETLTLLKDVSKGVEALAEVSRFHGARLNTIDARLARIEGELGFVKA